MVIPLLTWINKGCQPECVFFNGIWFICRCWKYYRYCTRNKNWYIQEYVSRRFHTDACAAFFFFFCFLCIILFFSWASFCFWMFCWIFCLNFFFWLLIFSSSAFLLASRSGSCKRTVFIRLQTTLYKSLLYNLNWYCSKLRSCFILQDCFLELSAFD